MKKLHSRYNSSLVYLIGNVGIGLAVFFMAMYEIHQFVLAAPLGLGFLIATVALAFIGLSVVVISRCLKNLEDRLPNKDNET
jgi:hypothetical protein